MRFKRPAGFFLSGAFCLFSLLGVSARAQTLIYCSEASPDYFNPQLSLSGSAFDAGNLLYSRLIEFDPEGRKLIPGLALNMGALKRQKNLHFLFEKKCLVLFPRGV